MSLRGGNPESVFGLCARRTRPCAACWRKLCASPGRQDSRAELLRLLEKLRRARREGKGRSGRRCGLVAEARLEAETRGGKLEEELRFEEPVPVSTTLLASGLAGKVGGQGKLGVSPCRFARLELRGVGEGVLHSAED